MGNVSTNTYITTSVNNFAGINYVGQSDLSTYLSNYDTNYLSKKYVTLSGLTTGKTFQQITSIVLTPVQVRYPAQTTMTFTALPTNNYLSYNAGTFTVLNSFMASVTWSVYVGYYSEGTPTTQMYMSLKGGNGKNIWMNPVNANAGASPISPNNQLGNQSIGQISGISTGSGCTSACNNEPRCAGWSYQKSTGTCFYYDNDTVLISNSDYDTYYNGTVRIFAAFYVSFNAGDTFYVDVSRACTVVSGGITFNVGTF